MSDIGGFDWWFRDRDYVLRDSVEYLSAESAAASRRAARISSQLSQVQGTLESRLDALTAAFDAYVELGDIREQLAAYAEPAAVRREAMAAIAALGDGQPAAPVDDRGTGYWIAEATNAVIAEVAGSPDPGAEQALTTAHPEAELFIVAAVGAVGQGRLVADRVLALLTPTEGRLSRDQQLLWQAVREGAYGPEVATTALTGWADQLQPVPTAAAPQDGPEDSNPGSSRDAAPQAAADPWWDWAAEQASAAGVGVLDWIEAQPDGMPVERPDDNASSARQEDRSRPEHDAPPADNPSHPDGLRAMVMELIGAGHGDEQQLLARSRELRAKIETPGGQEPERARPSIGRPRHRSRGARNADGDANGGSEDDQADDTVAVADLLRSAYRESDPGSADRMIIFGLIAPHLLAAVEKQASGLLTEEAVSIKVSVPSGPLEIGPGGADPSSLSEHRAAVQAREPMGTSVIVIVAAAVAGVALLAVPISLLALLPGSVVVFFTLIAIVGAVVAFVNWRSNRQLHDQWQQQQQAWEAQIAEATERAKRTSRENAERRQHRADQLDRIRDRLGRAAVLADPPSGGVTAPLHAPVTRAIAGENTTAVVGDNRPTYDGAGPIS